MNSSCFYLNTIVTFTGVSLVRRSWQVEPTGSRRRLPLLPGTRRPWWVFQLTARQLSSLKRWNRNGSKLCLYFSTDVDSCAHHRCGAVVVMCLSRGLHAHTKDTFCMCTRAVELDMWISPWCFLFFHSKFDLLIIAPDLFYCPWFPSVMQKLQPCSAHVALCPWGN